MSGRASDTAYAGIKQRIVSGAIPPNALIDEQEIAEQLGVSRTPVREALLRLEAERLVEIGRGKAPRHAGFQKGRSGNPKGRPKGSKNPGALLPEHLDVR